MAVIAKKRSVMTLYSGWDMGSHGVRIVLAEKGVLADIIEVNRFDATEDLSQLNPYNTVPTLVDRDLVLYQSNIIMEYLDERFPHPPLLPVYPVARAQYRLMMYRIEQDWYPLVDVILSDKSTAAEVQAARKQLQEGLMTVVHIVQQSSFFLGEEFSLLDCYMAPLLWRLPSLKVNLPAQAKPLLQYADRLFRRDAFQVSLTETEREMR